MTDIPQIPAKGQIVSEAWNKHAFRYLTGFAVVTLAIGTVAYHYMEEWTWVDSFYFSSVTLTTVGFGDFVPTSDASKIFTVFYIFGGISLIGATLNAFLKRRAERVRSRRTGE